MILTVRVRAKTDADGYRTIRFNQAKNTLKCNCGPDNWEYCAHVDAVLVHGERFMVHEKDRATADLIMQIMPPLTIPETWKGSWKRNKAWRGLPTTDRAPPKPRNDHLTLNIDEETYRTWPGVCFTGYFEMPRSELETQARSRGWRPTATVTYDTVVLVIGETNASKNKLSAAHKHQIDIIPYEDWVADFLPTSPFSPN